MPEYQKWIGVMGKDLGSVYGALWNELVWLNWKWMEYVALFGENPSRIDLINQAACNFFGIIQQTLWEDCLLHIARLTDPPKSAGKDNLCIRRLLGLADHEGTYEELEALIVRAEGSAEFCRDWRNRHIAHKDLQLTLEQGVEPLKPASRERVEESLSALAGVLNKVELHYNRSTTAFEAAGHPSGALSLLYVLDDGLRAARQRRERLETGNESPRRPRSAIPLGQDPTPLLLLQRIRMEPTLDGPPAINR